MAECIYFRYEDETPWHGDVFDHPYYKYYCLRYYCLKNGKKKEIFSWTCSKCPYYEEEKTMIHKMIACSEECLRLACCNFCKYVIQGYFFEKDKNGNTQIINGGPNGCSLHKDKEHQRIAKDCGYCQDFHCKNATEDNKDSWVVKEFTDEEH